MEKSQRIRNNRRQALGCALIALVLAPLVGLGIAILSSEEPKNEAVGQSAVSAPKTTLDARNKPFLNAEMRFSDADAGPDLVAATAEAIGDLGRRIAADRELRSAKTVLIMVADREGYIMHLTIDVPRLLPTAAKAAQPGAFLLLGREVGFNEIRGERAAREWCAGAHTNFCDQVP